MKKTVLEFGQLLLNHFWKIVLNLILNWIIRILKNIQVKKLLYSLRMNYSNLLMIKNRIV